MPGCVFHLMCEMYIEVIKNISREVFFAFHRLVGVVVVVVVFFSFIVVLVLVLVQSVLFKNE